MAFYDFEDETLDTLKHVGKWAVFVGVAIGVSVYFAQQKD